MHENRIVPFPQQDYLHQVPENARADWSIPELASVLGSDSTPRTDKDFGAGHRLEVGDSDGTLDMFPESGVVDYFMEGFGLTMKDAAPPDIFDNGILFTRETDTHTQSLAISNEGRVVFVSDRKPISEPNSQAAELPVPALDETEPIEAIASPSVPDIPPRQFIDPFSYTDSATNTKLETKKAERVEIPGRVGRDPRTRETKTGTLIAKFPLAEHPDGKEGETVWHTIVAFKDRAEFVRDNVKKGQELKVIGYRNEREYNGKPIQEINAVVVRLPKVASEPESDEST